jgi:hypothetical protein
MIQASYAEEGWSLNTYPMPTENRLASSITGEATLMSKYRIVIVST